MLTIAEIRQRKREASGFASTQIRSLALAFIAVSWALLSAHDEPLKTMMAVLNKHVANRYLVLSLAGIGFLITTFDLLQYLAIVWMTTTAERIADASPLKQGQIKKNSVAYKSQSAFFWAKASLIPIGGCLLLVIFVELIRSVSQ